MIDVHPRPTRVAVVGGGEVAVPPLASFHRVMDAVPTGGGWQVIQEPDRLRLLVAGVGSEFSDTGLAVALQQVLAAQGAVVPTIVVERVSAIPRGPTGKASLLVSKMARSAAPTGDGPA